ncbi:hypothetical protein LTR36_000497 [Oleoguttula mirabilis]|uniref:Thioesterase domain-containing protein n=1 Tax=Oleoguttula mirabilis TaxID=1507867 RepID=A0AAV9JPY1_9PEZI|nr:hypothetical protein LTR36_000497 [Oleoguttula mirabilis]
MANHPDFAAPWCQTLLSDPNLQWAEELTSVFADRSVTNSMFNTTLNTSHAIKARLFFRRPSPEPDAAVQREESCMLLSVGDGVDGKAGRAHGGFNALILDQVTGVCAHHAAPGANPPATATMTVDYKAPISTPGVILARAWATEHTGRKIWCRAVIEDGEGKVLASGKALFICPRPSAL